MKGALSKSFWILMLAVLTPGFLRAEWNSEPLRSEAYEFARKVAKGALSGKMPDFPRALDVAGEWTVEAKVYTDGKLRGQGRVSSLPLAEALEQAVRQAVRGSSDGGLLERELKEARFLIHLMGPDGRRTSVLGLKGDAVEATGDVAAVRKLSPRLIKKRISLEKEYLLRMMHPKLYGFYKFYDAAKDQPEAKLRTIYSSSSLWTLLRMRDFKKDGRISKLIDPIVGFILSMQVQEGPMKGAFYYSYDPVKNKKQNRFVVGTAAKTIFTLLDLYRRTKDPRYLAPARAAGDWLLQQIDPEGRVFPVVLFRKGEWKVLRQHSFLYSGQVLSAMSRLYAVTGDPRYDEAAARIARRQLEEVRAQDYYLGDAFRPKNLVSTSWAVMSFLDYIKIHPEAVYVEAVPKCVEKLLSAQFNDPKDLANYGRFPATYTSGSGWVNEVLVEVYKFCLAQGEGGCEPILDGMLKTTRWLIQNTYTEVNSFHLPNPARAIGGSILNFEEERVRTDAVCHAANSFVGLLEIAANQAEFSVPE